MTKKSIICTMALLLFLTGCSDNSVDSPEQSIITQENQEQNQEKQEQNKVEWQTQLFKDSYLKYEIPASWEKNDTYSSPEMGIAFFTPKEPTSETPSNVNVQINSLENTTQDTDYSDTEIQKSFHDFLIQSSGMPKEAKEGTFEAQQIGETWVYSLSYSRDLGNDVTVDQTAYFPMGFDYTLTIWATDYHDNASPSVKEIATHICQTLEALK